MRFYKENQVNPLGSCLPLLAQMPVFIALFYLLRGPLRQEICGQDRVSCGDHFNKATEALGGFGESFLFIPDLTNEATGGVLVVLMVLYVSSQLVSSLLMSVSADRNQRLIAIGLPVVFVFFIINFPMGLMLYWATTNLWSVGQGLITRRLIPKPKPPEKRTSRAEPRARGDGGGDGAKPAKPVPKGGPAAERRVRRRKKRGPQARR